MVRDRASRPQAKPLRLFVAVDIPEEVRDALFVAVAPIRRRFPKARWAPPENWHVTLKFLGATYPRLLSLVQEQVAGVAGRHSPFQTRLTKLGSFPSGRSARVLWAGLEDGDERLGVIAGELDEALSAEFKPETRDFTPHLTIARSDPPLKLQEGELGEPLPQERFSIGGISLYRSRLRRPAPVYEQLLEAKFEGPELPSDA